MLTTTIEYLTERQTPAIRLFHVLVLLLVISQILLSNFISFTDSGEISNKMLGYYGTWAHIIGGLILAPIACVFVLLVVKEHGLRYFFPYFINEHSQLKNDIELLKQRKIPAPSPYGLAAIVQGLGLISLLSTLLSGVIWFLSWSYGATWSDFFKETHGLLTGIVIAYAVGHGFMGLIHIYYLAKNR